MRRTRHGKSEAKVKSAKTSKFDSNAPVIIVGSVLAGYFSALSAGFTNWDDDRFITNNPLFHGPLGTYVAAAFSRVQFQAFHPLHLLSYLPDRLLWPDQPAGFHALNLALFALALVLGFFLLRRCVDTWPALAATLIVGLHPLAVESVAWVVGRKDILALLLLLSTLLVADREPRTKKSTAVACGLALAACLAKTSAVVLPIVLFAWLHFARQVPVRQALRRCLPFAAIALLFALPVPLIWRHNQMIPPARPLPFVLDVLGTLGIYARRVLAPVDLSPVYPTMATGQVLAGLVMGVALLALVAFWHRLPAAAKFASVAFIGCLLPVANITPLYFRFADRYALLAVVFLAWPVAALLAWSKGNARRVGFVLVPLLLGLELWTTSHLVPVWQDSLSLWQHAVAAQPGAVFAHLKLGETLREQGRFREAAASYLNAGQLEPGGLKGPAGLLRAVGEKAEAEGRVPTGSYQQWEQAMAKPGFDGRQMEALIDAVDKSNCHSCSEALLWLALRMFPQPDPSLVTFARKALDRGRTSTAMVYVGEVRDPNAAGLAEIVRRLNAPTDGSP
jgi:hypothetical protein